MEVQLLYNKNYFTLCPAIKLLFRSHTNRHIHLSLQCSMGSAYKTANATKCRLLQISECYKMLTVTKTATTTKRRNHKMSTVILPFCNIHHFVISPFCINSIYGACKKKRFKLFTWLF